MAISSKWSKNFIGLFCSASLLYLVYIGEYRKPLFGTYEARFWKHFHNSTYQMEMGVIWASLTNLWSIFLSFSTILHYHWKSSVKHIRAFPHSSISIKPSWWSVNFLSAIMFFHLRITICFCRVFLGNISKHNNSYAKFSNRKVIFNPSKNSYKGGVTVKDRIFLIKR